MKKVHIFVLMAALMLAIAAPSKSFAKTTNVRVNPIGALFGAINVDVDFKVSDKFTVGPTLLYWSLSMLGWEYSGFGFGVRGNLALSGNVFEDGWYMGPMISYTNLSLKFKDSLAGGGISYEGDFSAISAGALFGYQWMWDSFNINLGLGPVYYSLPEKVELESSDGSITEQSSSFSGIGAAFEFTLGMAF